MDPKCRRNSGRILRFSVGSRSVRSLKFVKNRTQCQAKFLTSRHVRTAHVNRPILHMKCAEKTEDYGLGFGVYVCQVRVGKRNIIEV